MKVKSESEVTQLCLTPIDPMDSSLPGSSVPGIFQARVLEWAAIAFSKSLTWEPHKENAAMVLSKVLLGASSKSFGASLNYE